MCDSNRYGNIPHTNATFHALQGGTVIIASKWNKKYLRFFRQTGDDWNDTWRGVFDATREDALRAPSCQFIVNNRGIGYELISKQSDKAMYPYFTEHFNRVTIQSNGDAERSKDKMRFKPMALNGTDVQKPDGNFVITTPLWAYLENVGEQNKRAGCIDWVNDCYVNTVGGRGDLKEDELLVGMGQDSKDKQGQLVSDIHLFQIETAFPADTEKWLANPDNKIACCKGLETGRALTSCVQTDVNWSSNRTHCDQYMYEYCHMMHNVSKTICTCFALQDLIMEDPDLRGLANNPPVVCAQSCQAEAAYKTELMKDFVKSGTCKVACVQILQVKNSENLKDLKQSCEVTETGGGGGDGGSSSGGNKTKQSANNTLTYVVVGIVLAIAIGLVFPIFVNPRCPPFKFRKFIHSLSVPPLSSLCQKKRDSE